MGGFFGGQSKAEKKGLGQVDSVFNYGLPEGQAQESSGQDILQNPTKYFEGLLRAGRSDTAMTSAPAINATLEGTDAQRRQLATAGTGRTGGVAEYSANAGADTQGMIDDLINQNMVGGRQQGAAGLTGIGGMTLENALQLLGLGSGAAGQTLQAGSNQSGRQAGFGQQLMGGALKALIG